jgi:hypothetical protein
MMELDHECRDRRGAGDAPGGAVGLVGRLGRRPCGHAACLECGRCPDAGTAPESDERILTPLLPLLYMVAVL